MCTQQWTSDSSGILSKYYSVLSIIHNSKVKKALKKKRRLQQSHPSFLIAWSPLLAAVLRAATIAEFEKSLVCQNKQESTAAQD